MEFGRCSRAGRRLEVSGGLWPGAGFRVGLIWEVKCGK